MSSSLYGERASGGERERNRQTDSVNDDVIQDGNNAEKIDILAVRNSCLNIAVL